MSNDNIKWMADQGVEGPGEADQDAEDYLSKLAKSILSKEKPKRPAPRAGNTRPPAQERPAAPAQHTQHQVEPALPPVSQPSPSNANPHRRADVATGWTRNVEMRDESGNFLPGTILVLEDGTIGVYKQYYPSKDYDIVYQLTESGRATPHGMPLYNYDVEPVGRLSPMALDQVVTNNRWDRDMVVFHLLKFKDVVHIPQIDLNAADRRTSSSMVEKIDVNSMPRETKTPVPRSGSSPAVAKPQAKAPKQEFEHGRQLTIDFGPNRRWEAVYWGKDELGHVVAHNTHDKWSLMHLDLNRFKDSVTAGGLASEETLQEIQKDFAAA